MPPPATGHSRSKPLPECGVAILGGTAGVGLETAAHFALQGSRIVLLGRNAERGEAARRAIRQRVPAAEVRFVRVDAADPADTVRAEGEARLHLGAIDVLINSTGPSQPPRLLHTIPIADVRQRVDEIMLPPLHMTHAVLPDMRQRRSGAIVTVASDAAKVATPGETLVGAAMAAIVMFSKATALEVKREGVRVNLLTPSLIADTPGAALINGEAFSAKMFDKAAAMAHLGVAQPADLAEMAVFLSSPAAQRITGQAISINGGISVA